MLNKVKEKKHLNLKNPIIVCVLAVFCCILWGSAFPTIKIGYEILNIESNIFMAQQTLNLINNLTNKFNISIKLYINKNSNIQMCKFIDKIDNNISCMIYNQKPYLSTRKFLNMQSKILAKKLTNICLTQCCKRHYSKSVIGSIIIQLPCSACRYTLYLEDFNIFDCEINKNLIGNLSQYTTLDKVWNHNKIVDLRTKLIDENKC